MTTPLERNWAEHDNTMRDNATLEDCRKLGASHAGYGWSKTPWGHWTEEQQQAYREGFEAYKKLNQK